MFNVKLLLFLTLVALFSRVKPEPQRFNSLSQINEPYYPTIFTATTSEEKKDSSSHFTSLELIPTSNVLTIHSPCFTMASKEPTITSPFPSTSTSKEITKSTTQPVSTATDDKHTTIVATNPTQVTPTTSQPWITTISTDKTPTSSIPPITSHPIINDSSDEIQCTFNGLYPANNFTCDQYLVCINGVIYLMNCPNGLAFNDEKKSCDWAGNVKGCNPRAFENFSCPYEVSGKDGSVSKVRYRDSCSQFIACYRRKPRLLSCMDGMFFDEGSQDCVYYKHVTTCKRVIYSF